MNTVSYEESMYRGVRRLVLTDVGIQVSGAWSRVFGEPRTVALRELEPRYTIHRGMPIDFYAGLLALVAGAMIAVAARFVLQDQELAFGLGLAFAIGGVIVSAARLRMVTHAKFSGNPSLRVYLVHNEEAFRCFCDAICERVTRVHEMGCREGTGHRQ